MRRRTFLAVAGAGAVSGCLARYAPPGSIPVEIRNPNVATEKFYPAQRYQFTHSLVREPEQHEKDRIAYDDLDPEVQETVRRIVEEEPVGFGDPPPDLIETAEQSLISCPWWCSRSLDYFELTYVETDPEAPPLIELGADVTDKRMAFRLTLANPSDHPVKTVGGDAQPFGVLRAVGIERTDHSFDLWGDFYSSDNILRGGDSGGQDPIVVRDREEVAPGTDLPRTYRLSPWITDEFLPGSYVLSPHHDASSYIFGEETDIPLVIAYVSPALPDWEVLAFRVTFDLA